MDPEASQYDRLMVALAELRERGVRTIAEAQAARRASEEARAVSAEAKVVHDNVRVSDGRG